MKIDEINDKNLKKYLSGLMSIEQLSSLIKGNEPFYIKGNSVLVKDEEEYKREMIKRIRPNDNSVTSCVNTLVRNSFMFSSIIKILNDNRVNLNLTNSVYEGKYIEFVKNAQNLITWGMKQKQDLYQNKNCLFFENFLIRQSSGVFVDNNGYFSDSSIVKNKEYDLTPENYKIAKLYHHIKTFLGIDFGINHDPNGPILVALQMPRDNGLLNYCRIEDNDRDRFLIQTTVEKFPDRNIIIRPHPRERDSFKEKLSSYNFINDKCSFSYEEDVYSLLKQCSALITVNSTLATEALCYLIPVAVFGESTFTGTENVVLDCSKDTQNVKDLKYFEPDEWNVIKYLCSVYDHYLKYDSSERDLLENKSFINWIEKTASAKFSSGIDKKYDLAKKWFQENANETLNGILKETELMFEDCAECRKKRLKNRIIGIYETLNKSDESIQIDTDYLSKLYEADLSYVNKILLDFENIGLYKKYVFKTKTDLPVETKRYPKEMILDGYAYGHLGDTIAISPIPRKLKDVGISKVYVKKTKSNISVFENNPYIDGFVEKNGMSISDISIKDKNIFQAIQQKFGVKIDDVPFGEIYLSEKEKQSDYKKIYGAERLIVLSTGCVTSHKHYKLTPWQDIVNILAKYGTVITPILTERRYQTGTKWKDSANGSVPDPILKNCIVLKNMKVREYFSLVNCADLCIGPIGGSMHVARSFHKPYIVICPDEFPTYHFPVFGRRGDFDLCWLYPEQFFVNSHSENINIDNNSIKTSVMTSFYGSNEKRISSTIKAMTSWTQQSLKFELIFIELLEKDKDSEFLELLSKFSNVKHIKIKYDDKNKNLMQKECLLNIGRKNASENSDVLIWADGDVWAEDKDWFLKIRNQVIQNGSNALIQGYRNFHDTEEGRSYTNSLGSVAYENKTGQPGLIWACYKEYWDEIGGLNPYCISGSGDVLLIHETSTVNPPAGDDVKYCNWWKGIFREGLSQSRLSYAPVDIMHENHGPTKERAYFESRKVIDFVKAEIKDIVFINDDGILEWKDGFDNLKRAIGNKKELSEDFDGACKKYNLSNDIEFPSYEWYKENVFNKRDMVSEKDLRLWYDNLKIKYIIAKQYQPKEIFEIGVRYGYSASAFALACPRSKYTGIDIICEKDGAAGGIGNGEDTFEYVWTMLKRISPDFDVELLHKNSQSMPCFKKCDFIHVDGDHSIHGCLNDLAKAYHALRVGGVVLVDDYYSIESVRDACNLFLAENRNDFDIVRYFHSWRGEFLIQKLNKEQ